MMTRAEREALAVDIARRVRTISVQPVPDEFLDMLSPQQQQTMLYTKCPPNQAWTKVSIDGAGSLVFEFMVNNERVHCIRFDRASEWKDAL